MAHITFVHGIMNKDPKEQLLRRWRAALKLESTVSVDMVYWADVLYREPSKRPERLLKPEGLTADVADASVEIIDDDVASFYENAADSEWVEAVVEQMKAHELSLYRESAEAAAEQAHEQSDAPEGLLPVPWVLKKPLMAALLRDAHHYLFDVTHTPRPGETYQVRKEIRRRFCDVLKRGNKKEGPHVVVGHSMGSVIAYDCLKRVDLCEPVSGFVSLGSPLGISAIQDKLRPEWSRRDGFPRRRLPESGWRNFYDWFDIICGGDPKLANDFQSTSKQVIVDTGVRNNGVWRHDAEEYLAQSSVQKHIGEMLELR